MRRLCCLESRGRRRPRSQREAAPPRWLGQSRHDRGEGEPMRYKDKVTIVTGGSKGIGAGCVKVFVEEGGSKVVFCSRNEKEGKAFEAEINKKGGPGQAVFMRADVSKVDDIKHVVDATVERFGRLDCLINNA